MNLKFRHGGTLAWVMVHSRAGLAPAFSLKLAVPSGTAFFYSAEKSLCSGRDRRAIWCFGRFGAMCWSSGPPATGINRSWCQGGSLGRSKVSSDHGVSRQRAQSSPFATLLGAGVGKVWDLRKNTSDV